MIKPVELQIPVKIAGWKFFLQMALSLFVSLILGFNVGAAFLLGSLSVIVPEVLFAKVAFASFSQPKTFLRVFMWAEIGKITISAIFLALVLDNGLFNKPAPILFGAISALGLFWIVSLVFLKGKNCR